MNDHGEFDPIADSLRRQFSPPSLEAVEDRVAQVANAMENERASVEVRIASPGEPVPPRRRSWAVPWVFAVSAALLLLLLVRPWDSQAPREDEAAGEAEFPRPAPRAASPQPAASKQAGADLHRFLNAGARLPSGDEGCEPPEPPECLTRDDEQPWLAPGGPMQQVGECGGRTGTVCAEFGLPADRALLVEASTGARAIVCIERAWTDPRPVLPPGSPYTIHRAELGEFIVYEVTKSERPQAIEFLRL